jgi:uncharacterized RDD family membrane protein YckC
MPCYLARVNDLAEWPQRALGLLIDLAIGVAAVLVLAIVGAILGAFTTFRVLGILVTLGLNLWFAQQVGQTGQSPGMRAIGLKAVGADTGEPLGAGLGVVRWLVHFVLGFLCGIPAIIDYLFPLWDAKKQTIADKAVSSVVTVVPKQPFSIVPPVAPAQPM